MFALLVQAINDEFLSTDFSSCLIKLENVDAQLSLNGGVHILVTGSIGHNGTMRHRFSQSFFLAPQESGGYFVLNDMLRYDSLQETLLTETNDSPQERLLTEINDFLPNHVDDNTHSVTFTSEPGYCISLLHLWLTIFPSICLLKLQCFTRDFRQCQ